jgi:hypothetical protein
MGGSGWHGGNDDARLSRASSQLEQCPKKCVPLEESCVESICIVIKFLEILKHDLGRERRTPQVLQEAGPVWELVEDLGWFCKGGAEAQACVVWEKTRVGGEEGARGQTLGQGQVVVCDESGMDGFPSRRVGVLPSLVLCLATYDSSFLPFRSALMPINIIADRLYSKFPHLASMPESCSSAFSAFASGSATTAHPPSASVCPALTRFVLPPLLHS